MSLPSSYYDELGIAKDADKEAIHKAYRRLAAKYHPDRHQGLSPEQTRLLNENFLRVTEAYEVLIDPEKRRAYDAGNLKSSRDRLFERAIDLALRISKGESALIAELDALIRDNGFSQEELRAGLRTRANEDTRPPPSEMYVDEDAQDDETLDYAKCDSLVADFNVDTSRHSSFSLTLFLIGRENYAPRIIRKIRPPTSQYKQMEPLFDALFAMEPKSFADKMQPIFIKDAINADDADHESASEWLARFIALDPKRAMPILYEIYPYAARFGKMQALFEALYKRHPSQFMDKMQNYFIDRGINEQDGDQECAARWLMRFIKREPQRADGILSMLSPIITDFQGMAPLLHLYYERYPDDFIEKMLPIYVANELNIPSGDKAGATEWLLRFIDRDKENAPRILELINPSSLRSAKVAPLLNRLSELCGNEYQAKFGARMTDIRRYNLWELSEAHFDRLSKEFEGVRCKERWGHLEYGNRIRNVISSEFLSASSEVTSSMDGVRFYLGLGTAAVSAYGFIGNDQWALKLSAAGYLVTGGLVYLNRRKIKKLQRAASFNDPFAPGDRSAYELASQNIAKLSFDRPPDSLING